MSDAACAKCGASLANYFDPDKTLTECPVLTFCLQKRLDNQSALLRSVTGKLEEAYLAVQDADGERATLLINQVLEALS